MKTASRPAGPFQITPQLPGDKSITHRAYLLGAMGRGETVVTHPNRGEDCAATLRAVETLGARVEHTGQTVRVHGRQGRFQAPAGELDLGNSGTGLRLLLGILAAQPFTTILTGDASLRRRPVERVLVPLRRMGARADASGDHPPVAVTGGHLRGIETRLPVPSAQVKSALLLAGVQAEGRTIEGGGASRDHTERMLRVMGVAVDGGGDRVAVVGPTELESVDVVVPGDPSAAAFYMAAAGLVPGSVVTMDNVGLNPTRSALFPVFSAMGLEIDIEEEQTTLEPRGRVHVRGTVLQGVEIEPSQVPGLIDELPALAVAASFARGPTRVRGAGELRVKESDRLHLVAEGLTAVGARIEELPDGWRIEGSGGKRLRGGAVRSGGDHRVAMAFLMAGLACEEGVVVVDSPGIETSDPHFMENLRQILKLSR